MVAAAFAGRRPSPAACCGLGSRLSFFSGDGASAHLESRLELADVGRLARRLVRRVVAAARTEDAPVQRALWEHLGPQAADVPVVRAAWPGYDWVNVQVGLDAWLAGPGRRHELAGITGFHPTRSCRSGSERAVASRAHRQPGHGTAACRAGRGHPGPSGPESGGR